MEVENLDIVTLTESSIASEHICCGFSDKKSAKGYKLKKDWLCDRFMEGYQFTKFDIRGKAFIEYAPAEFAWRPIDAPGYLCIHCFWVSGYGSSWKLRGAERRSAVLHESMPVHRVLRRRNADRRRLSRAAGTKNITGHEGRCPERPIPFRNLRRLLQRALSDARDNESP